FAMLPGVAAHGLVAHTGYVVIVRDRLPRAAIASAATLLVAALCAIALVPRWGAVGGAASLSVALTVRGALLLVAARRARSQADRGRPEVVRTLDDIRRTADPATFPREVLDGASTVASFFSAAFLGRNDCIFVADAGIGHALLVDVDD